jgi:putative acetyltransferase
VEIVVDDLTGPQIARFLDEHVAEMLSITPPESKHALDLETLRGPGITFWSVMDGDRVVGCGALKQLDTEHAGRICGHGRPRLGEDGAHDFGC